MVDVVVIGAGPVGLACALEVQRVGLTAVVVDKGALVNSIIGYPTNMEFFSTPELLEIGGHPFPTSSYKPLREDGLDYYRRVAQTENLDLRLYERVTGLEGEPGKYEVVTEKGRIECASVIIATGFYDVPNYLNVPGEDLPHVNHYYKEPYAHVGQDVVVVGAKNSSAKAALALARAGARATLVVRGPAVADTVKYWIRPDLLNRIAEGRIRAYFNTTITAITPTAAVFSPVKICGRPDGIFMRKKVCQRDAPRVRNIMRAFSSAACRPAAVPTTIGKVAIKAAKATLDEMPKPSQARNSGAKATLGIVSMATR